jgi:hypothetical protein
MSNRAESLAALAKFYRENSHHQKCYDVCQIGKKIKYPDHLQLFLERGAYQYKFDYELSIVCYYINKKEEGLQSILKLIDMKDKKYTRSNGNANDSQTDDSDSDSDSEDEYILPRHILRSVENNSQFYI